MLRFMKPSAIRVEPPVSTSDAAAAVDFNSDLRRTIAAKVEMIRDCLHRIAN